MTETDQEELEKVEQMLLEMVDRIMAQFQGKEIAFAHSALTVAVTVMICVSSDNEQKRLEMLDVFTQQCRDYLTSEEHMDWIRSNTRMMH